VIRPRCSNSGTALCRCEELPADAPGPGHAGRDPVLREIIETVKLDPAFTKKPLTFDIAEVTRHHEAMTRG